MSRVKGQHYVNQAYLRGFAVGAGKKVRLHVYERDRGYAYSQHPRNVAKRQNFYSFKTDEGTYDDSVEQILALVESEAIPAIGRLAQGQHPTLADRESIALFVGFQEYRVPFSRTMIERVSAQMAEITMKIASGVPGYFERVLKEMAESGEDTKDKTADDMREFLNKGGFTIEADPRFSLVQMVQLAPKVAEIYKRMKWLVLHSDSADFFTSDNPVIRRNPQYDPNSFYSGFGLVEPAIEILFPLTKRCVLAMIHDAELREQIKEAKERDDNDTMEELRMQPPKTEFYPVNPETETMLKQLVIDYASKLIFSPSKQTDLDTFFRGPSRAPRLSIAHPAASDSPDPDSPNILVEGEET